MLRAILAILRGSCLLLVVTAWPLTAAEGTPYFRCNHNGRIEFRQTACETGIETSERAINTSNGLTPSEPGVRLKSSSGKSDTVSRSDPTQGDVRRCWKKREQLARVERRLRAGYRSSEYQRLHDRQREYEDYLYRFCR